jgi:DNA-directed RNA polymerase specialized sigma24 family protein
LRAGESQPRIFVDRSGQPFHDRLQRILRLLEPRLRRHQPLIRDEVILTEILEEAGCLLVERELQVGPIEKLRGYAWVTVRNVKTSRLRRGSMRLQQATLDSVESTAFLVQLPAKRGTPDAIERHLLMDEIAESLSAEERHVYTWKKAGFSSQEIARYRGTSVAAVDTMFHRVKRKAQAMVMGGRRVPSPEKGRGAK